MEGCCKTISLIPWLKPESANIYLDLFSTEEGVSDTSDFSSPFRFIDAPSPLFTLIRAVFRAQSAVAIKKSTLLIQQDAVRLYGAGNVLTNCDIDRLWQSAVQNDSTLNHLKTFAWEPESAGIPPVLPLWRSLFYCGRMKAFFHPPCPECGVDLELCTSDDILESAGLPLYTDSLERFLFCAACTGKRSPVFYSRTEYTGKVKNGEVSGLRQLVSGIVNAVTKGEVSLGVPCSSCDEKDECLASEMHHVRIQPLRFYPFRMLVTDDCQLSARDFLRMVAGENSVLADGLYKVTGVNDGCFWLTDGERRFLEVLYIKIALLENIIKEMFASAGTICHFDLNCSLDNYC